LDCADIEEFLVFVGEVEEGAASGVKDAKRVSEGFGRVGCDHWERYEVII